MDDILISGTDDNNHIANFEAALKKLSEAGLQKKQKHFFMVSEVSYCSYEMNGWGIKPVKAKVEALQNTPVPENVTKLHAFVGMLNYYLCFLPDIVQYLTHCYSTRYKVVFED